MSTSVGPLLGVASHGADTDCFREMEAKWGFLGFQKRAMKTMLETTKGANTASGLTKSKGGLLDNCSVVHRVTQDAPYRTRWKTMKPFCSSETSVPKERPCAIAKAESSHFHFPPWAVREANSVLYGLQNYSWTKVCQGNAHVLQCYCVKALHTKGDKRRSRGHWYPNHFCLCRITGPKETGAHIYSPQIGSLWETKA